MAYPPGHFFDYELHPNASEAGTSFYHSHVGFQANTASGPLIVMDYHAPPFEYDEEIILQIGDFYLEDDQTMESCLTSSPNVWPGDPAALMINGHSGLAPYASATNAVDPSCEPWTMNVVTGKRYRVRVIGTTALSLVLFGIIDHDNLTIIETDNSYVNPVETPYMQVDTGQRFSFLLETKEQSQLQQLEGHSKFWIQFATREGASTVYAYAILKYTDIDLKQGVDADGACDYPTGASMWCPGSPPSTPVLDLPTTVTDWLEYTFMNPALPGYERPPNDTEITRRIIINTAQDFDTELGTTVMNMDRWSWFDSPPLGPSVETPYLVEILQNGTINGRVPDRGSINGSGGIDPYSLAYPAWIGEVLEIVWENDASVPGGIYGPHPLHAHGGPYWDMGSGSGSWSAETHAQLLQNHSSNGMPYPGSRRDTTMLYKYALQGQPGVTNGWRVWRVRVTEKNVGVWLMHCHILQHVIMGQSTVWVFGTPDEIKAHTQPVNGSLEGYFTYGGHVVGKTGEEEKGIMVAHFFDE
ncbi:L-ascorbate oxidase [Phialophora macrospora]|uniref:L-ascorbate oxidase n=1 Tax=Phialophora macrospora TaxID=1851006 RepID=A0A0D2CXL1_9EURO|nr:L-ascorbate oxidase [Phialophora macrospora]